MRSSFNVDGRDCISLACNQLPWSFFNRIVLVSDLRAAECFGFACAFLWIYPGFAVSFARVEQV